MSKTSTNEVLCDGCGATLELLHPHRIFAALRGPTIGHKKLDAHDRDCLVRAIQHLQTTGEEPGT